MSKILFVFFFIGVAPLFSERVTLSLTNVVDKYAINDIPLNFSIRTEAIAALQEKYDCIILARTPGLALLEEQRARMLELLNPELMPYPPAADYIVYPEILKAGSGLNLRVNLKKLEGEELVKSATYRFEDKAQYASEGAAVITKLVAEQLKLRLRANQRGDHSPRHEEVWAVLPWQDLESKSLGFSERSIRLMDLGSNALTLAASQYTSIPADKTLNAAVGFMPGATELQAGEIGRRVSAEYLLYGTVETKQNRHIAHIFAARSIDAAILACRRIETGSDEDFETAFNYAVGEVVGEMPRSTPLPESSDQAALREAQFFLDAGNNASESVYFQTNLYSAAFFLAQESHLEPKILERFYYAIPSRYDGYRKSLLRPGWENAKLPQEIQHRNQYALEVMYRLIGEREGPDYLLAYAKVLEAAWHWDDVIEIMDGLIARQEIRLKDTSKSILAAYLNSLSISGRGERAVAFYEEIKPFLKEDFTGQVVHQAAANHFRRQQDVEAELSSYMGKAENGWTFIEGVARFSQLLRTLSDAEERIRLLNMLQKSWQKKDPDLQFTLCLSYRDLGKLEEAASLAESLLERKKLGKLGFNSESEAREHLASVIASAGPEHDWPTAFMLQSISPNYRMYLQPVGRIDRDKLEAAAQIAGEFFGTEFIVRPSIPAPTDRGVFYKMSYNSVPMLRRLVAAAPPPEDAIYQAYVVDRLFLVYGRGEVGDIYRKNLGTMISLEMGDRFAKNDGQSLTNLANLLIRQFRYYVERSQGISYEEAPVNPPCVNANPVSKDKVVRGYCRICKINYRNADMKEVYALTQLLRDPNRIDVLASQPRTLLTDDEKVSIEEYARQIRRNRSN